MAEILHLSDTNFEKEVLQASQPVLVDFWAAWCGPCRTLAPVLEDFATEQSEKIKVAKLDVDENADTATKYNIRSIPTLILFEKGEPKKTLIGAMPKKKLVEELSLRL